MEIKVTVNGEEKTASVPPETTLLSALREQWGMTGSKSGCEVGDCGACTVLLDGKPVNSCLVLAGQANGRDVLSIEGLGTPNNLDPIQKIFETHASLQCGFCGPGVIMSAKALLNKNPDPTRLEVRDALAGNLCRCTGYVKMIDAVMELAANNKSEAA
ncbi:MAG: (2Fe-2S)-binding protein [Rhodospirillales bacterium]|nr:(2Fe-2S)-binding protein [Rhodospirillales bacterium]